VAATLLGAGLCATLGTWQYARGGAKAALLDAYAAALTQPPVEVTAATPPHGAVPQRVHATGRYDAQRQLLLDNQVHDRVPGYHVWTPLVLARGGIVLVNRGWVPLGADRGVVPQLPAPAGPVRGSGLWRSLPEPGLRLAAEPCRVATWPRVVNYPRLEDLQCLFDSPPLPGVLLLDAQEPGGWVRDWPQALVALPPQRHYGYAAQWWALAATVVVLFVFLNLKRR
jgi:surfeit locus 1 family protein